MMMVGFVCLFFDWEGKETCLFGYTKVFEFGLLFLQTHRNMFSLFLCCFTHTTLRIKSVEFPKDLFGITRSWFCGNDEFDTGRRQQSSNPDASIMLIPSSDPAFLFCGM